MTGGADAGRAEADVELDGALLQALERIASTERLLVALDFDGTLAPHADDPDDARALPAAREAGLALAAEPGVTVALVSGRAIESLQKVTDAPPEVLFSGSHGAEYLVDGELTAPPLGDTAQLNLESIRRILDEVTQGVPGTWVETKAYGYALHTRLADPEHAQDAEGAAREAARDLGGVFVRDGKDVLEFSVVDATKADALAHMRELSEATAVLFAGDDVTDEDGFAALGPGDVGIKVGQGETRARFRVASLEHMPAVLTELLRQRERHRPADRGESPVL